MSVTLFLRWLVPLFALAVAGTVFVLAGFIPAGLTFVAFLLGVVTTELHHMRWSAVEQPERHAAADGAFLAFMEAEQGRSGGAPQLEPEPAPPAMPKRNFRPVLTAIATGSGEIRLPLVERRALHQAGADARAAASAAASSPLPPVEAVESVEAPPPAEPVPDPAANFLPEGVTLLTRPVRNGPPIPAPEPAAQERAAAAGRQPPPPRVTIIAPRPPEEHATEPFRAAYGANSRR